MFSETVSNAVGLCGVLLYIVAYAGVQTHRLDGNNWVYSLLNGLAAGCILVSLFNDFNLPSAIVNGLFGLFSVVGILRRLRKKPAKNATYRQPTDVKHSHSSRAFNRA